MKANITNFNSQNYGIVVLQTDKLNMYNQWRDNRHWWHRCWWSHSSSTSRNWDQIDKKQGNRLWKRSWICGPKQCPDIGHSSGIPALQGKGSRLRNSLKKQNLYIIQIVSLFIVIYKPNLDDLSWKLDSFHKRSKSCQQDNGRVK